MATYKGKPCKTDCSGHIAGESYFNRGGRTLTRSSSSFNNGMRIGQSEFKQSGGKSRLRVTKRSK